MALTGATKLRRMFNRNKGKAFTVEQACAVTRWDRERFLDWFRRERKDTGGTLGSLLLPIRDPDSETGAVLGVVYYCRDQRYYDAEATYRNQRAVREIAAVNVVEVNNRALLGRAPDIACDRRAIAAPPPAARPTRVA